MPAAEPMSPALERVLLAASDLALTVDAHGRIVHVLARDAVLAERLRRLWAGQTLVDTVESASRPKVDLLLAGPSADSPTPRHLNHVLAGQPTLPVLYTATVYPSSGIGDGPRWLLTGRDLRDTLALQQRLVDVQQTMERDHWRFREAETRYRSLFQAAAEAVVITDPALRVLDLNPSAQALLASPKARRPRSPGMSLLALVTPDDADALAAAAATVRSLGHPEHLRATLADSGLAVHIALSPFQQDGAVHLLVRLRPVEEGAALELLRPATTRAPGGAEPGSLEGAYVVAASDALVFTDGRGRIMRANPAFARLAQLASEKQAEGEPLDRWFGRSGVELQVLLANLRDGGNPGLLATEVRGALGLSTPVEVSANALGAGAALRCAFSLRDTSRRLAPGEDALPRVPSSVRQLSELVGRVPLKQIVAETSDLIEKLSIEAALQMTRDNRALAAQMLGLSRQSLYVKLRRFGMGGLGGDPEADGEESQSNAGV
jgi:transcriptional regulator PpsR